MIKVNGELDLDKLKICVITFNYSRAFKQPLSNMREILGRITPDLYTILGSAELNNDIEEKSNFYKIRQLKSRNIFVRLISYFRLHLITSFLIIKLKQRKNINTCVFFMEGAALLSILISKLLNINTIWVLPSNILSTAQDYKVETKVLLGLQRLSYYFIDRIIVYSDILITEWGLERYKNKIAVSSEHFLDFTNFKMMRKYNHRWRKIGYVGRLSGEKGVFNLVKAISLMPDCDFQLIIIGDGDLRSEITEYIVEHNMCEQVKLTGWIAHEKLPDYLNELRLLVVPSYTEGLPNIMLEAMACGTPVLAASVGAIPDVIEDGETGFVLNDNSPECIAESVLKILDMSDDKLEQISVNARKLVEEEFIFENVIKKWSKILENLN